MGFQTPSNAPGFNTGVVMPVPAAGIYAGGATIQPLDVVDYGGLSRATVLALANNTSAVLLAAPAVGFAYRLHSFKSAQIFTNNTTGNAYLSEPGNYLAVLNGGLPDVYLGGVLTQAAVTCFNVLGIAGSFTLIYDLVELPHIE